MAQLRFGIHGLHRGAGASPETLCRPAQRTEDAGFDSIWLGDHLALPVDSLASANPALEPRLEVLSTLAFLAGVTTKIRLAAGIVVVPQRQPVLLAKQLATIDVLSGGRLIVGVGTGYVAEELHAFGVSMDQRAARTDEYIAAMRALWGEEVPSFSGEFTAFSGVAQRPLPVQRPHPPIVVGGHSPQSLRRAARIGSGWYGWDLDVERTASLLHSLREAVAAVERSPELGELEVSITPAGSVDTDVGDWPIHGSPR